MRWQRWSHLRACRRESRLTGLAVGSKRRSVFEARTSSWARRLQLDIAADKSCPLLRRLQRSNARSTLCQSPAPSCVRRLKSSCLANSWAARRGAILLAACAHNDQATTKRKQSADFDGERTSNRLLLESSHPLDANDGDATSSERSERSERCRRVELKNTGVELLACCSSTTVHGRPLTATGTPVQPVPKRHQRHGDVY
ncbi:hypothetical protein PC129_g2221 [Phytophthora cactorum]|nr:hypothetical protein PC112_g13019 [Phytophthora cactorum]KAG2925245.1 hypothetical protein PC114_g4196 [Phytophthora cactorum]KAG2951080.1 hypothetical protein PC117_g3896 [Phytophthora cactorum]KAG3012749.1 hypothetical protein PC120_g13664 [Phytophthora cactorum]KAG3156258.1 hypothetical protein C6341_g15132 [Phytophthora cactorum]